MLLYGQYVRKSDDDKSVTEKSIGEQLNELQPIIEREQLSVVKTWKESKSAKIPNCRSDYAEMIQLIEEGVINAIICWMINRLIRNMEEGGKLVQLFIDGKIQEIRTPSGIYRTGDNIMPLVIEAASATQFSLDHTKNVNRGMKGKFLKGGCNYKTPQGYYNARHPLNLKVGVIERDPARYDLICKAWDMFLTGAYTPVQVIATLNDVWGYRTRPTKELPSSPLGRNYGYHLFTQPFYAGYVRERGKLVQIPDFVPMVTMEEFQQAQELMGRKVSRQARYTHNYPYTGLMICGYCGQQITGEKKKISTDEIWENYHCADSYKQCTKMGIARARVEEKIISELNSVTIDKELCEIALNNIVRDLEGQTRPVQSLYEQQNHTLGEIEKKLGNLADMWINGMMRDETLYKEKEVELTTERNNLVINTEKARNELEKMRANAMAASNYIVFARDNFMVASDERKREIAHALGIKYVFFGRDKKIELEINPLLIETVKFAKEIQKALELAKSGSTKEKASDFSLALSVGGP
jgi:DNA invertase Pin-like site-specific DNA recombinase